MQNMSIIIRERGIILKSIAVLKYSTSAFDVYGTIYWREEQSDTDVCIAARKTRGGIGTEK